MAKDPNSEAYSKQYKMPQNGGASALKWVTAEGESEGGIFGHVKVAGDGSSGKRRREN